MSGYEISSLKKGLEIVELLREKHRMSLTAIAAALEMNKTTAFRLLYTLEEASYVVKMDKLYELHPRLSLNSTSEKRSSEWHVSHILHKLGASTSRNVYAGILSENSLLVHHVYVANQNEAACRISTLAPAHQSALGKAILAHLKPAARLKLLSQLASDASEAIDWDLYLRHLDVVKQQNYAVDYEDIRAGLHCIAAPVFKAGEVCGAISISDSSENMPKRIIRGLTRQLIEASQKLSIEFNRGVNQ
ncbi:IclR family transcriptional regulator [Paenibacillus montaniterrae]|uniref:IclR family transcriptional regulator n=1 Tax=Paenibacillus montaniterrae TaxID=429341 RepID=UPI001BCEF8F6|nr:IclR family transcriptional regulator [Paenibacillus montaniterrae]